MRQLKRSEQLNAAEITTKNATAEFGNSHHFL
jgi:hypothetical protein